MEKYLLSKEEFRFLVLKDQARRKEVVEKTGTDNLEKQINYLAYVAEATQRMKSRNQKLQNRCSSGANKTI